MRKHNLSQVRFVRSLVVRMPTHFKQTLMIPDQTPCIHVGNLIVYGVVSLGSQTGVW